VFPAWCLDCTYDPDGSRTLRGQTQNGKFTGETIELTRDGNGKVSRRRTIDAETGEIHLDEVFGPHGVTEETQYQNGKPCGPSRTSYDENGFASERISIGCDGKQESRAVTRSAKDGQWLENTRWNAAGVMTYHETYDPATDEQRFTTFDDNGVVNLTWTFRADRVLSFWRRADLPDAPRQFGDDFTDFKDNGDAENFRCHSGGQCDASHVHFVYLSEGKRNPTTAEWRDADGNLLVAAYTDYELDAHQNWTTRKVWVWSPELGERKLYETDTRTIQYWDGSAQASNSTAAVPFEAGSR
jgi:hypothetical protein